MYVYPLSGIHIYIYVHIKDKDPPHLYLFQIILLLIYCYYQVVECQNASPARVLECWSAGVLLARLAGLAQLASQLD